MYNDLEELKAMAGIASAKPGMERSERPGGPLMSDRVPVKEGDIKESFRNEPTIIEFNNPVAVGAVNLLNRIYTEEGETARAFMQDKYTVSIEVDVFGGNLVDITNHVIDELGGGTYGREDTFTTDDGREEPISGRMSDDEDTGVGGLIDMGR